MFDVVYGEYKLSMDEPKFDNDFTTELPYKGLNILQNTDVPKMADSYSEYLL